MGYCARPKIYLFCYKCCAGPMSGFLNVYHQKPGYYPRFLEFGLPCKNIPVALLTQILKSHELLSVVSVLSRPVENHIALTCACMTLTQSGFLIFSHFNGFHIFVDCTLVLSEDVLQFQPDISRWLDSCHVSVTGSCLLFLPFKWHQLSARCSIMIIFSGITSFRVCRLDFSCVSYTLSLCN